MTTGFDLSHFELVATDLYVSYKPDWIYNDVEEYLLCCTEFVRQHPHIRLLIFTHHPHCFTLGKGLQKLKSENVPSLIDFDESLNLPFQLYKLKRGGGLTFHYPGQLVLYPIVNLTNNQLNVHDFMVDILSMTKALLAQTYNLENLVVDRDLLGLWCYGEHSKQKLASIGLAITRFTTYHGMALNFLHDERMFQAIDQLNPCGLPGNVYQSIEKLTSSEHHLTSNDKDVFIQKLLSHFKDYFNGSKMMLKQRSSDSVIDSISL